MSWYEQLAFTAPRSEAAVELGRLIGDRAALEAKLDQLDAAQQHAGEEVARLSSELVDLEKRGLEGEQVSSARRSKAEDALTRARVANAAPWAERRSAIEQAIGEHRGRVQAYVGANFGALVEEVEADGKMAAEAVDAAAEKLVEAYYERDRAAKRLDALLAVTRGASRFGDVALARSEPSVREAEKLLAEGGEVAPRVRDELRSWQDLAEDDSQVEEAAPV
jgi:hypothetical protein